MNILDMIALALVPPMALAIHRTGAHVRTAPTTFLGASLAAMAPPGWLLIAGHGEGEASMLPVIGGCLLVGIGIWAIVIALRAPAAANIGAKGDGMDAVRHACRIHDEATDRITRVDGARSRMTLLDRLRDSFVTTGDEAVRLEARGLVAGADELLERIVGPLHAKRTEALIAEDHAASREVAAIQAELAPLDAAETEARDLHQLAVNAVSSLEGAISALDSATTYETLDLVSSNKGIAMMSSMQNSTASSAVEDASAAIAALSRAVREDVHSGLTLPSDTMDLILDMALDSAFDFMSIFTLSKLSDAKDRCEEALDRVRTFEQRLGQALRKTVDTAAPTRQRLAEARQPFWNRARDEMPRHAQTHLNGPERDHR